MVIRNFADVKVHIRTEDILKTNVVYMLTFPNGKQYIGITTRTLKKRLTAHCNGAFNPKDLSYNAIKSKAIRKYLSFEVSILYEGDDLEAKEMEFIALYDTFNFSTGYNSTSGGEGTTGRKHTEESKRKISAAITGEKNPFYGREHTDESKLLISQSRKGKGVIPITQYSKDGRFIKNWLSTKEASVTLKIDSSSITKCLKNKAKTCGGFVWKYTETNN